MRRLSYKLIKRQKLILLLNIFVLILVVGLAGYYICHYNLGSSDDERTSTAVEVSINDLKGIPYFSQKASVIAAGDVMLSRNVEPFLAEDISYPFVYTKDILDSADLVFVNLESPVCEGRRIEPKEMVFRTDPEDVETLAFGNVSIVSLANNHMMDFGEDCLSYTLENLGESGIKYIGAGNDLSEATMPQIIKVGDIRVAFLSFNDDSFVSGDSFASDLKAGTARMDIDLLQDKISSIKRGDYGEVDVIFVSMHAGDEYTGAVNDKQRRFARAAIDAGADIVLGHHPHVVQEIEEYKGKLIFYSLGNFIFDQISCDDCREELLIKVIISKEGLDRIEVFPLYVEEFAQPQLAKDNRSIEILSKLKFETEDRQNVTFKDGKYVQSKYYELSYGETYGSRSFRKEWIYTDDKEIDAVFYKNRAFVVDSENILWASPLEWDVSDVEIGDVDNDGALELVVAFWRVGDFGKDLEGLKPKRGEKMGSHLYLYRFKDGEVSVEWGGSTVDFPIIQLESYDIDNDDKNEIIVVEGRYEDYDSGNLFARTIAVWEWNGWGFSNEFRGGSL